MVSGLHARRVEGLEPQVGAIALAIFAGSDGLSNRAETRLATGLARAPETMSCLAPHEAKALRPMRLTPIATRVALVRWYQTPAASMPR